VEEVIQALTCLKTPPNMPRESGIGTSKFADMVPSRSDATKRAEHELGTSPGASTRSTVPALVRLGGALRGTRIVIHVHLASRPRCRTPTRRGAAKRWPSPMSRKSRKRVPDTAGLIGAPALPKGEGRPHAGGLRELPVIQPCSWSWANCRERCGSPKCLRRFTQAWEAAPQQSVLWCGDPQLTTRWGGEHRHASVATARENARPVGDVLVDVGRSALHCQLGRPGQSCSGPRPWPWRRQGRHSDTIAYAPVQSVKRLW